MLNHRNYGKTGKARCSKLLLNIVLLLSEATVLLLCVAIFLAAHIGDVSFLVSEPLNDKVLLWITVEGALYTFYVFRRLIIISYWTCVKDPRLSTAKINCFTFVVLNTLETGWFIWGNVLFYAHILDPNEHETQA